MKKLLLAATMTLILSGQVMYLYGIDEKVNLGPIINDIIILTPEVERFGKFEAEIDLSATFSNPYDYDEILVTATFSSPSGSEDSIDGFFMQDYSLNEVTGSLSILGSGAFRVRFSPTETGTWNFVISIQDATGHTTSAPLTFNCIEITHELNKGFIRTSNTNYLQFDNGEQYIAIGENIAWQNNNPYLNYKTWLDNLSENGGNFFRLWHAHWGLGIEWSQWNGFQGLLNYKQSNCFYQDWLLDYCAENGIYIMLALQHHGPVSTQVNPNWNESPYNVANGGACQTTIDFFTIDEAKTITKNRYKYIVARWGYSRNILCWELFNEVHWTDNFEVNKADVANWHFEMADYLKNIDPNNHLISTSYGDDLEDEEVWSYPTIDFTQSHTYSNVSNIERTLSLKNQLYLNAFEKPTLNGEFGLGISSSLTVEDEQGIHIHNALWGGLFGGGFGTAMTWWWDNYIHPQDLYHHLSGVAQMADEIPFLEANLSPVNATAIGAPDDLILTPTLGWAGIGESEVTINSNGSTSPENAQLGQFLYGAEWNTQFRSPPSFIVNFPEAGLFSVLTGSETGTNPIISIRLNGITQLEQPAETNAAYSFLVPAGQHIITVDNTGTDWITISEYLFEGLGSQIDAYVLVAESKEYITGWLLNNRYNHNFFQDFGEPLPTPTASVMIDGVENGIYSLRWFDPSTGIELESGEAHAVNGKLTVPTNPIQWDAIFIADSPVVSTEKPEQKMVLEVYPNPIKPGATLNISSLVNSEKDSNLTLLNLNGKVVQQWEGQMKKITIPATLVAGPYILKSKFRENQVVIPVIVIE